MRVFISYTHDDEPHRQAVLDLATFLAQNGIWPELDSLVHHRQDWQAWATRYITEMDYVLVVASQGYRRVGDGLGPPDRNLGGQAEAALLRDLLQSDRPMWTRRILPVLLPGHHVDEIPLFLQPYTATHYYVTSLTLEGSEDLLRVITSQPAHVRPPLGSPPVLPPRSGPGVPSATTPRPWRALSEPVHTLWLHELLARYQPPRSATVELHLVPVAQEGRLGVRKLHNLADELASLGRSQGLFSHTQGLDVGSSDQAAWAFSADERAGQAGLTVHRGGQRTCWFTLPAAQIGWILDEEDLTEQLATRLGLLLEIQLPLPRELAPAIGLEPTNFVRLGKLREASASMASLPLINEAHIRLEAEDAVSVEGLQRTPGDIADELVARLAVRFRR